MSKSSKKKIVATVNVVQVLHGLLRKTCRCTEKEVEILDALLQRSVPVDDFDSLQAIHEGKTVSQRTAPPLAVDMGNGTIETFSLNLNHPHMLTLEYLEGKYGHRFAILYWLALGSNPREFTALLRKIQHAPAFSDLFSDEEVEA